MKKPPFENDVIIAGDDGNIYHLTPQDLAKFKVAKKDVEGPHYGPVRDLLENGVAAAAIPTREETVETKGKPVSLFVAACYLLNLASLKKHQRYEDDTK